MANTISGSPNPPKPAMDNETFLEEMALSEARKASLPVLSTSDNVETETDQQVVYEALKNSFEGLRDGVELKKELQMLVSTLVSSQLVPVQPPESRQDAASQDNSGGVEGVSNSQAALRKMQQVLGSDSRFIQQVMDYLNLSSPARKDEHLQNMGLEYQQLLSTLSSYQSKREQLLDVVQAHFQGRLEPSALRQQLQPLISYIDPALMVIDNSLRLAEARLAFGK